MRNTIEEMEAAIPELKDIKDTAENLELGYANKKHFHSQFEKI